MVKLNYQMREQMYPDFETAFKALYKQITDSPHLTEPMLATIWFEMPGQSLPLFFQGAIDLAHQLGILTEDGKLNEREQTN